MLDIFLSVISTRASSRFASIFSVSVHHIRGDIAAVELHALDNLRVGLSGLGLLNGDYAVSGNLLHSLCDQGADFSSEPEEIAPTRAMSFVPFNLLGVRGNRLRQQPRLPWRCRGAITIGFAPAATFFRPSRTKACARTVAVVVPSPATSLVLVATSLNKLCAHVLESVVQLDLLSDGNTVVGDQRSAELLIQNNIAALRTDALS